MIQNATITNINAVPTPGATGKLTWGGGSSVSIRCFVEAPRMNQITALASRQVIAQAIAYIGKPLPAGVAIGVGYRMTITVDGSSATVYELQTCDDHEKAGGLSHFECALKGV